MRRDGLRLPDFIIAGAPRCATTWLSTLADLHPSLAMAKPVRPEPKFFLVDELYGNGIAAYRPGSYEGFVIYMGFLLLNFIRCVLALPPRC